jgi:CRP/FNR family transcriptional regulator, cyclic AMP receptor protein
MFTCQPALIKQGALVRTGGAQPSNVGLGQWVRWHGHRRSTTIRQQLRESANVPSILDLCQALAVQSFEPGAVLLAEGKTSGLLYILIDGEVEVLKGDLQVNLVSDPGAIFGEISVLLDIPAIATVRAVTPCNAHVIESGDAFLQSHKEIAYQLSKLLAHRLHGLTTYLVDLRRQFEHHDDHLSMVDDILETLVHHQRQPFTPGSDRDPGI